jgi:hypothetical protein
LFYLTFFTVFFSHYKFVANPYVYFFSHFVQFSFSSQIYCINMLKIYQTEENFAGCHMPESGGSSVPSAF